MELLVGFWVHTYEQALPPILVQTNRVLRNRTAFMWRHDATPSSAFYLPYLLSSYSFRYLPSA